MPLRICTEAPGEYVLRRHTVRLRCGSITPKTKNKWQKLPYLTFLYKVYY
jgi:hypothetical protein